MPEENNKMIVMKVLDFQQKQLDELKQKLGILTTSEVLRYCINYTHKKLIKK